MTDFKKSNRKKDVLAYTTIVKKQWFQETIEKSNFIAYAVPIEEEYEVKVILDEVHQKYSGATHYVYAYTLGINQEVQKFSDDGEPSGTGGMPVLEIFRNRGLCNLMVVVVRYFGGIKLGTGGLKRAYARTALQAIEGAKIINKLQHQWIRVTTDYSHWGKIEYLLAQCRVDPEKVDFAHRITFDIPLLPWDEEIVIGKLVEIVGGIPEMEKIGYEFLPDLKTD